ncbi:MAG: hypothetical protein D6E12_16940 [Desulfovibrio sp.]|nr:MAG: hypothetical protein D6E12_16940 [Desulfovibrio sp.]
MVLCHICGVEVFSGWICGVVPAGDKYKLGLCRDHDTVENRATVQEAWEELLRSEMRSAMDISRQQAKPSPLYEIRILFLGGGTKTVTCTAYDVNKDKDLLVLNEQGELDFYPLQHVRHFTVREKTPTGQDQDDPGTPDDPTPPPAIPNITP